MKTYKISFIDCFDGRYKIRSYKALSKEDAIGKLYVDFVVFGNKDHKIVNIDEYESEG